MRLGVLDVGSNTLHLLVVDAHQGARPIPAFSHKAELHFGEHLDDENRLTDECAHQLRDFVEEALRIAEDKGVHETLAFATSAVREAANGDEVLRMIEEQTGVTIRVLPGPDESRLTFLAARRWHGWSAGRLLMLDIGGGSLEIAAGHDEDPTIAISLPLGAGRLTREFLTADPPTRKQLKAVRRHVRDTLSEVLDRLRWEGPPRRVVATSKTFKQLARLTGASPQRKGPFVTRELVVADLRGWIPRLARIPAAERAGLRGISKPRARQVVAGAVAAEVTLSALDVPSVEVCPWALREGILLRHLERVADTPALPLQPLTRHPDAAVRHLRPAEEQPVPS